MATNTLTNVEKELNKIISKRSKEFKNFRKSEFEDKTSNASSLLLLFLEFKADNAKLWTFLKQVDSYLYNTYKIPLKSSIPTFAPMITCYEFIENIDSYKADILNIYQLELEEYISGKGTKGLIHYNLLKPIVKNLFDINDELTIKKLVHYDYIKKEALFREQINEWFQCYNFSREINRFIKDHLPNNTKREELKELITAYSLLKDEYFNKNPHSLVFLPNFLDTFDKRSKHKHLIDKLLEYKFPNMSTSIAKKIIEVPHPSKKS